MSRRTRNDVTEEVHVNLRVWPNVLTTATGIRPWPNSSRANTRGSGEMRKGANGVPPNFEKNVRNSGLGQPTSVTLFNFSGKQSKQSTSNPERCPLWVPHLDWHDDLSPLYTRAFYSEVSDPSHMTRHVATSCNSNNRKEWVGRRVPLDLPAAAPDARLPTRHRVCERAYTQVYINYDPVPAARGSG